MKLNIQQEVRTVRRMLVVTIIAFSVGLGILFGTDAYESSGISIMSSFGEITILDPKYPSIIGDNMYQNNELSFQLSKPNNAWNIRLVSETLLPEEIIYLESKGYLNGIYLEKEYDKRFFISVIDVQSENFQLNDYVTEQITTLNSKENIKVPIRQISKSNDWAIFSFDRETNTENGYAEQLLFLKDNRLYMLQYSGKSPDNLTESEKSDYNSILNSFEVL